MTNLITTLNASRDPPDWTGFIASDDARQMHSEQAEPKGF